MASRAKPDALALAAALAACNALAAALGARLVFDAPPTASPVRAGCSRRGTGGGREQARADSTATRPDQVLRGTTKVVHVNDLVWGD